VPTLNSNTAILYDPLSTSNFRRGFPAKFFWQRQILAFSKARGNHKIARDFFAKSHLMPGLAIFDAPSRLRSVAQSRITA
jgi:hypothetical protein